MTLPGGGDISKVYDSYIREVFMSVNGWPSKIEELQQQLDIATQRWWEYEQAYNTQRQRAEAAEARVVNWISTEERLPETQLRVLAVMLYDGRKPRIIRAMHIPAKTVECLDWEFNDAVVYDSESERHYFGAGWYELMEEGEYDYVGPLSDSVTHWAEMPELPEYFRQ